MKAFLLFLALGSVAHAADIRFHTKQAGFVSLNVYGPDGALAGRLLAGAPLEAGDHAVSWDGRPGRYTWRALFRQSLALKVRGWIGDFGGDRGAPSAVAADDSQVYLGWSLATADADAVVACDPSGAVRWTHRRGPLSGCRALAVDGGAVYVLGGEGADSQGRALYKLDAKTGAPIAWPDGRTDLKILSLWPAKGKFKPETADYLAVKNGRIYLSFPAGEFIAVLDAKSGAYLQTIVGAPPGPVDSVATKSDLPGKPGTLIDSDFVVTALKGAAIGKVLLAHDPIWVLASEFTPLGSGDRITALAMIGDGAKHHMDDIFVALAPPANQVQARPALDTGSVTYLAGMPGGRPLHGVWEPDRMDNIRGVALDAAGRLWVAEGGALPALISVWTTDSPVGRLVRDFFAPPDSEYPVAVDPLDPRLLYAGGCEWRIDPATGRAACLGVLTRDPFRAARFAVERGRLLLVLTASGGAEVVLERAGDGDYRPHSGPAPAAAPAKYRLLETAGGPCRLVSADGFDLGPLGDPAPAAFPPPGLDVHLPLLPSGVEPALTEAADGRVFITARRARIWEFELTGLETLRPLASGETIIPPSKP